MSQSDDLWTVDTWPPTTVDDRDEYDIVQAEGQRDERDAAREPDPRERWGARRPLP